MPENCFACHCTLCSAVVGYVRRDYVIILFCILIYIRAFMPDISPLCSFGYLWSFVRSLVVIMAVSGEMQKRKYISSAPMTNERRWNAYESNSIKQL